MATSYIILWEYFTLTVNKLQSEWYPVQLQFMGGYCQSCGLPLWEATYMVTLDHYVCVSEHVGDE